MGKLGGGGGGGVAEGVVAMSGRARFGFFFLCDGLICVCLCFWRKKMRVAGERVWEQAFCFFGRGFFSLCELLCAFCRRGLSEKTIGGCEFEHLFCRDW